MSVPRCLRLAGRGGGFCSVEFYNIGRGPRLSDGSIGGNKIAGHPGSYDTIKMTGVSALLRLVGKHEVSNSAQAAICFSGGATCQDGYTAGTVAGSGNKYGIKVDNSPLVLLNRNERPQINAGLGGSDLLLDGQAFSYAQLEANGVLETPGYGSKVIDLGSTTTKSKGQTYRGVASFAAESSKTVVLPASFADTNYIVHLTADDNVVVWCPTGTKTASQFVIQASSTWTGNVAWRAEKL